MNFSKCILVILWMSMIFVNVSSSFAQTGCHKIDWETDCSGNPFPEGFYVTANAYDCIGVTITNNLSGANPLVLFNSSVPTGGDIDLGTPSSNCPTCSGSCPGVSNHPNGGLTNCVSEHLILITEENPIDANGDGLEDEPDDHNVTDLTYDFVAPVTINSLSFVDDSQGTITFTYSNMTTNTITLTGGLDNDVYTQIFNQSDVISVNLTLSSSGAVSVADFCYDVPGAPPCDLVAPVLGADVMICEGDDPGPIEVVTGASSSITPITYQWQQSLTGCSGFGPIPGATSPTYNPGVLVQSTYFKVVVTTDDGSQICIEESNCISYIEQTCNTCVMPVVNAVAVPPTCVNGAIQNDGNLQLNTISVGDAYHWSIGSTFDDNGGANDYSNANSLSTVTFPLKFATGLSNPNGTQDYTIRIYNGDNGCFEDFTMTMVETVCLITVGNYVWIDEDGDADQDAGEPGIPGVTVNLFDGGGTLIATTITDFNGGYLFEELPYDIYEVMVDASTLPAGLTNQTFDLDGTGDDAANIGILEEDNFEFDFGYNFAPPVDTNSPAGSTGAIGDRIWSDDNSDGIQDAGEVGIENVTVNLLDDSGSVTATTTTDPSGYYIFDNLPAGAYSVEVDDTTLPTGFTTAPTGDPDSDGDNISENILLGPGDVYLGMDFGYNNPTSYNIGDTVFIDINANGTEDAGETPIPGVTVTLIDDTNGNGLWDTGELPIANTVTDANGMYLFTGVSNGDYVVFVTDTNNATSTLVNSADPDGGLNEYSGVTIAGADDLDQDFGYTPQGHTAADAILGDFVFLDTNGDGVQTPGEPGIENVKVELFDINNILVATTYTDVNGMYLFGGLPADTYTVLINDSTLPGGGATLTQSVDPDGTIDNTSTTTLPAGGQDLDQDFGYLADTPNTIQGTIWEDSDGNGLLDESTLILFENVTVVLFDDQMNVVATTITDANGDFSFEGLPDGSYKVDVTDDNEVLADLWKSNSVNPGMDNNSQFDVYMVSVTGGSTDSTADFGYYPSVASIGNYVWFDANKDGLQTPGEAPIAGVLMTLEVTYPDGTVITTTEVTDVNGFYSFDNLLLDEDYVFGNGGTMPSFVVTATAPPSHVSTTIDVNGNGDDQEDSEDPTGTTVVPVQGQDDVTANADPTAEQLIASYDFGFILDELSSIGNYVWLDEDGDGDQDAGEAGIPGVTVNLIESGVTVATTITDFNGGYLFEDLPENTYQVSIDNSTLPTGLNSTYNEDGTFDNNNLVTVPADNFDIDFGYNWVPIADTNNPAGVTGAIGDRIWSDANSDGVQDAGEPGVENVTVNLLDDTGAIIATTTTDPAGYYIFDALPAGVYSVEVDDATLPAGFTTAPTGDPDADGDSVSDEIILGPGDVYLGMDFGYNNPTNYNIGDKVFVDANANGAEDAGELPIANVTVTLVDDANGNGVWDVGETPIANTITDAAGMYLFTGVSNGDYVVFVTDTNDITSAMTNTADPDGGTNEYSGVTIAGADDLDQDFGYAPEGHTSTDGIIGDFIFLDTNGDDALTIGEPGIEAVKVELYDASNVLVGTTFTDKNGMYLFGGLSAGTYTIKVDDTTLPASASIPAGLTQSVDPDGTNDNTSVTTITTGGQDLDQDFGYKATTPNTIEGTVWEDIDGNGTLDELAPVLFEDVTIVLFDDQMNIVGTTVTDANGDFSFEGLPDGTYKVDITDDNEVLSDLWKSNGTSPGVDDNSQLDVYMVSVAGGSSDQTADFGYYPSEASIGNYVWLDTNKDGLQTNGETPLAGILMTLEITYPDGTVVTATEITDANGFYSFDNLLLDEDYAIGNGGPMPTFNVTATAPSIYNPTVVNVNGNGNDQEDSEDPTGTIVIPEQGMFDVTANANPNMENPIASYDFGFAIQSLNNIGNFVWIDEDGDGDQDAGEVGIPGATVFLEDASGNVIATEITDLNGGYLFEDLPDDTYTVVVDPTSLPAGLTNQTYDLDGILNNESTLILNGDDDLEQDFGYNYAPPADTNNPSGNDGGIGDRIWSDANGDGVQDPSEVGIGSVTINLLDDVGAVIGTTTSDPNGYYFFDNLPADVYAIEVDPSTLPTRFITTPTGDPDGDFGNVSDPIPLAPGDIHLNMDFGYQDPSAYTIGDRIYLDQNVNGAEDAGEAPIENVTVALIDDANGNGIWDIGELPIATDLTDANGNYLFTGLGNGDYVVVVTNSNNVLDGLDNTADPDGGLDEFSGVTIAGADNLMQDFGYAPEGHAPGDGLIGSKIFLDADRNTTFDSADPGLEGVNVLLYNSAGQFIASTITDLNGCYLFGGLPADTYAVEVGPASLPVGVVNNVDPDGGNNNTSDVTIATGGVDLGQDFGYEAPIPNTVSGTIWEDRDAIGDLDEPIFFAGVTVLLRDVNGNIIGSTITDVNGDFEFTGLPDGTYTVEVTDENNILNGHWLSDGTNDGANNNSQDNNYTVSVAGGSTNDTADFGYYIDGASIGNRVWEDSNSDGIQDPGEAGISGAVVTLVIDYPDGTSTTLTQITDANGFYSFDNLLLDEDYNTGGGGGNPEYTLSVAAPNGYQTTIVDANGNGTDGVDSEDPAGTSAIPTQGEEDTSQNSAPGSEEFIAQYDFGFQPIVLPVTLISFSAISENCSAVLSWKSESETDFSHYVVEKSFDGRTFEYLGQVASKPGDGIKTYRFEDKAITGKVLYRLKMVDLDGTYEFTRIVTVESDCESEVSDFAIFPNPAGMELSNVNIRFTSNTNEISWISISDKLGREVMRFPVNVVEGENRLGVDISNLASGVFFVSINGKSGKITTQQFVKINN